MRHPLLPLVRHALAPLLLLLAAAAAHAQVVAEDVGQGVVRFFASQGAADTQLPSLTVQAHLRSRGPAPEDFPVTPVFEEAGGRTTVRIPLEPGTSLYGLGDAPGPLLRNGGMYVCWSADSGGKEGGERTSPRSFPWLLALRADGTAFGVLADTPHRCEIDLTTDITIRADGPSFPVIVVARDTPEEVVGALAGLTGYMTLPPRWALGAHHALPPDADDRRVRAIGREFRDRDIPCDAVWFGLGVMEEGKVFTIDERAFPDIEALLRGFHEEGFRTVLPLIPAVKAEEGWNVFETGTADDLWIKAADRSTFRGESLPGESVFPDFANARTRTWWRLLTAPTAETGFDGFYAAYNTPLLIDAPDRTIPADARHAEDNAAEDGIGGGGTLDTTHARVHNAYGSLMAEATREGLQVADRFSRPFVATHASWLGGQRSAATPAGPTIIDARTLAHALPATLNLGLSAHPLAGPAVGGPAAGTGPEGGQAFFARAFALAAALPFCHTTPSAPLPWTLGEESEGSVRAALQRRSRLVPYLYTLAREASITGLPIARPLFFTDPKDPALRAEGRAFLLGEDLLVIPKSTDAEGAGEPSEGEVRLPAGAWRSFHFGDGEDPHLPELRLRAGAILPTGPAMEHDGASALNPLLLIVHLDADGNAEGALYEDEGEGYNYFGGRYLQTIYRARTDSEGVVTVGIAAQTGLFPRPSRALQVRLLLADGTEVFGLGVDGEPVKIQVPALAPREE